MPMIASKFEFARRFSFLLLMCRTLFLLVMVFELSLCQGDECSAEGSCVLPQPLKHFSGGGQDLDTMLLDAQCFMGCVDQYGGSLNVIDQNTPWPTLNFSVYESDCGMYQKVYGCKQGCMQRHIDRVTTINRCRDNCYSSCVEERNCVEAGLCPETSTCSRSCRKTYCRFGCEIYDTIHASTSSSFQRHPPPSTQSPHAVILTPPPDMARDWLYSVDARESLISSQNVSNPSQGVVIYSSVAYIVKLSTDNGVQYFWQKHHTELLDLSPFACNLANVSFAVISKYSLQANQQLTFSPSASLCVPGVGGYPSQLNANSIRVTYTEDQREDFLGYSVAQVTWDRPNNFQYLTSYTVRVYPDEQRCGGDTNVKYEFHNIDRDLTEFTFRATTDNGLWRFACSYIIEVVALPTSTPLSQTIGAHVTSASEVTESFPPFELNCSREWDEEGRFSISLSWLFPNDTQLTHITQFILLPTLTLKNGHPLQIFDDLSLYNTNHDQLKFSATTQKFTPVLSTKSVRYTVKVRSVRNNLYTWRRIPVTQSCSVPATPLPPRNISMVTVSGLDFDPDNQTLEMNVDVVPSDRVHGTVELYEVAIRRRLSDCLECEETMSFFSESSPIEIYTPVQLNDSDHCLYLSVRMFNNYNLSSHWSEAEVLPLDEECLVPSVDSEGGVVSVFYESLGREKEQVLQFGCQTFANPDSLTVRLQQISERLDDMQARLIAAPDVEERATQLDQKLQSIDEKLDHVLEILAQQFHQGT